MVGRAFEAGGGLREPRPLATTQTYTLISLYSISFYIILPLDFRGSNRVLSHQPFWRVDMAKKTVELDEFTRNAGTLVPRYPIIVLADKTDPNRQDQWVVIKGIDTLRNGVPKQTKLYDMLRVVCPGHPRQFDVKVCAIVDSIAQAQELDMPVVDLEHGFVIKPS